MTIKGIARDTLKFILEVSKSMAPEEFAGLLQEKDGIITDVMILPGTESSSENAVIKLFMMPNVNSVGSVHSHPGSIISPSKADLRMFDKTGNYHIIAGFPYNENNWACYNRAGEKIDLPVLDVEIIENGFDEEEFFEEFNDE